METTKQTEDLYPGAVTMNEWVFSQTGPIFLNVLSQLLEKYPGLQSDISEMTVLARATVAAR